MIFESLSVLQLLSIWVVLVFWSVFLGLYRTIVDRIRSGLIASPKTNNQTIKLFEELNEPYKIKIINDSFQENDFQIYQQGETNFFDLCKGPHLPSFKFIGEFKLTKVSGAYWRGDSKNEMLQRIYGTSWASQKDLDEHLKRIEEAEKRDHRKLGKEMDLFHFREESPGSVFWHERGWALFQKLINYMRSRQDAAGYKEVNTPEIFRPTIVGKNLVTGKNMERICTHQKLLMKKCLR